MLQALTTHPSRSHFEHLQLLKPSELKHLLTCESVAKKLFPTEYVIVSYEPYRIMSESNVRMILENENPVTFVDVPNTRGASGSLSASFATFYYFNLTANDVLDVQVEIDIYASSREVAIQHLYRQVFTASETVQMIKSCKLWFNAFSHGPATREDMIDAMGEIGIGDRLFIGIKETYMLHEFSKLKRTEAKQVNYSSRLSKL